MFKFQPFSMPTVVYVVGCGGTGSRLVPMLAQFLRSITRTFNPAGWLPDPTLVLIDGDIVEEKNLLRQNFIKDDVNKNKAAVLANRYSRAFGVNIIAIPHFLPERANNNMMSWSNTNLAEYRKPHELVIMCVDSPDARRRILHHLAPLSYNNQTVYFDAGNEDNFGQVKMFTSHIISSVYSAVEIKNALPERLLEEMVTDCMPFDPKFYENMVAGESTRSCADLDQTLAINSIMATGILGMVQNYYYMKPFTYNELRFDLAGGNSEQKNTIFDYASKSMPRTFAQSLEGRRWSPDGSEGSRFKLVSGGDLFSEYIEIQKVSYRRAFPPERKQVVKEEAIKSLEDRNLGGPESPLGRLIAAEERIIPEVRGATAGVTWDTLPAGYNTPVEPDLGSPVPRVPAPRGRERTARAVPTRTSSLGELLNSAVGTLAQEVPPNQ